MIEGALVGGVKPGNGLGDFVVGVGNGFEDALAEILRFVAIAKLECFVFTSGSARRDRGAAQRSAIENDIGFDGGVAARIDDLAGADASDLSWHVCVVS